MEESLFKSMTAAEYQRVGFGKPASRIAEFELYWQKLYQDHYKTIYLWSYAKERSLLNRLLVALDNKAKIENRKSKIEDGGLALLKLAAERLFAGYLTWFKGQPTIGNLSTHINSLLAEIKNGKLKPTTKDIERYRSASRS